MKTRRYFRINLRRFILIMFPFTIVFSSQWLSSLTPGQSMPGDNGDSRFNLIILEYVYQSIFVNQTDVFDMPFFYPFQSVGGFSDLHVGSVVGYALPRLFGFGIFVSMQIWVAIGCLLNFLSSYFVMRKLQLKPIYAVTGSLIFAFGLPVLAQQGHLQLLWRCATPFAIYFGVKFVDTFQIRMFVYFIGAIALSFLFGVYTGVGTLLVSLFTILFRLYFRIRKSPNPYSILKIPPESDLQKWRTVLGYITTLLVTLTAFYFYFNYWAISRIYEIERSLSETIFFSPKPVSWISSYMSLLWEPISRNLPQKDGYWENQLFVGLGTTATLFIGCFLVVNYFKETRFIHPFIFAIVSSILLVTLAGKVSIFLALSFVPGFNSVRAPGRISLLLLFPIALVVAWVLQSLIEKKHAIVVFLLFLSISADLIFTTSYESKISTWVDRPNRIMEDNKNILVANPNAVIFVVPPEGSGWSGASQLDGMFIAQQLGRKTLNGYSGFTPINAPVDYSCQGVENWLKDLEEELDNDKYMPIKAREDVIVLSEDFSCEITWSRLF